MDDPDPQRGARLQRVIEDVMRRHWEGHAVSNVEIIERHPDLMPELERELELLAILQKAAMRPRPARR